MINLDKSNGKDKRDRAQISAELIVVLAAVLAVSVILVSGLDSFAEEAEEVLRKEIDRLFDYQIEIAKWK